ncbi:MAG: phosphodiesterase [Acidimicrobiales bacterium]
MTDDARWTCVQLSDLHIVKEGRHLGGVIDTAGHLRTTIDLLHDLAPVPDLVLITGDLVNDGHPLQYEHLRSLLADLRLPWVLATGNHDDPQALLAAFPDHPHHPSGRVDHVVEGTVRVVVLDDNVPGQPGGDLVDEQLAWLEAQLEAAPNAPTIVALHHPPFPTGIDHMDAMALAAPASVALAQVVGRHPQVERVVCGHLHRTITTRWAGTLAMTAPSVAMAVALELRPGGPEGWTPEPPQALVHVWSSSLGLVSHHLPLVPYPVSPF